MVPAAANAPASSSFERCLQNVFESEQSLCVALAQVRHDLFAAHQFALSLKSSFCLLRHDPARSEPVPFWRFIHFQSCGIRIIVVVYESQCMTELVQRNITIVPQAFLKMGGSPSGVP